MFEALYRHDGWRIGLIEAPASALLTGVRPPVAWLPLDLRGSFAADPFLIEDGGRLYCFFEELPYATNRGHISYAVVGEHGGSPVAVHAAFRAGHHLSYPFLLRYGSEILCIPEAGESGRITAWAARDFPNGWYERHTLIDGFAGVDPTVFRHEGRWWMLATNGRAACNSELHAFFADDLLGQWHPHRGNPVKRGLAGTRPGGRPFSVDGVLYRPAQDCTVRYGQRLIVNEILALTPERFIERAAAVLEPDPGGPFKDGLHTANACGGFIAVDGNRLHFEPRQALRAVGTKVRRLTGLESSSRAS